jgi:DNA-binding MarR family transcriptional regulator
MMIKNGKNRNKFSYTLLRVVWKLFEVDRKTRYYGTDEQLFEAEIHMIKSIKENEGIHVTGLAELLGVTKGAVSQIIMKLQKKDMIVKDTDPRNLSRLILRLTSKGETAYINHEKLHQEFDELVNEALESASTENVAFLKEFLNSLERRIDHFENDNNV